MLSESENKTIAAGLNDVIMDHFVDVVDRNGATDLVFRSGATKAIQPGSWIVNCTGYFMRDDHPYEPYVSASGAVVSIQPRSATTAFDVVHGLLPDAPAVSWARSGTFRCMNSICEDLRKKSNAAFPFTLFTLAQYNFSLIADSVPTKVFPDCGLDFDRWYPLPRRMLGTARFMLTHRREREHQRRTLDTVRERFDVRCGPLSHAARSEGGVVPAAMGTEH